MTDKQSFLEKLNAALLERGISPTDIEPYLERFDRFYDRMVADSSDASSPLGDIDTIADNIAAQVSDRYDEINRLAERTMTVQTVDVDNEPTTESDVPVIADDEDGYEMLEVTSDVGIVPPDEAEAVTSDCESEQSTKLPDYVSEEKIQDNKLFWILFAVSLPITLPLTLGVLSVFAAAWAGLAALIVASLAALVAMVTVGTAASLIGIIYGIIQLFTSVPVGLYEIGIGIVVAGIVMFSGILLYNFAIRFVPWLIKLVGRLLRYTLKQLRVLFNFLRRECAKL